MKNEIRKYFPAFFDVDESDKITIQFETLGELIEIPFVKIWSSTPDFHKFAVSSGRRENQALLMAQLKEGYEWWVVGILKCPVEGLIEHTIPEDYYSDWPRSNFKGKLSDFDKNKKINNEEIRD